METNFDKELGNRWIEGGDFMFTSKHITATYRPDLWARSEHRGATRRLRQQIAAGSESSKG